MFYTLKDFKKLCEESLNIPYDEYKAKNYSEQINSFLNNVRQELKTKYQLKTLTFDEVCEQLIEDLMKDDRSIKAYMKGDAEWLKYTKPTREQVEEIFFNQNNIEDELVSQKIVYREMMPYWSTFEETKDKMEDKVKKEGWLKGYQEGIVTIISKERNPIETIDRIIDKRREEIIFSTHAAPKRKPLLESGLDLLKLYRDRIKRSKTDEIPPTLIADIKNNFDTVKLIEVYKHFKTGLVEKKYLTEVELIEYLKAAFEKMTVPETLFKIKDAPTKQKVYKVFYEYYKNIAGKPHGKQNKYAALLGKYFEGYKTSTVSSNFNK